MGMGKESVGKNMITLKIPIILILKILLRIWQISGALVSSASFLFIGIDTILYPPRYDWLMFFAIGSLILVSEWITILLFGYKEGKIG